MTLETNTIITIISMFFTFGATFGSVRLMLSTLKESLSLLKKEHEELAKSVSRNKDDFRQQFHQLNEIYVSYPYMREVIDSMKETQRETREDVRKILDILSERK